MRGVPWGGEDAGATRTANGGGVAQGERGPDARGGLAADVLARAGSQGGVERRLGRVDEEVDGIRLPNAQQVGRLADALLPHRELTNWRTHRAKVTKIKQDKTGVTVAEAATATGAMSEAKADFCVCTIPLGVLNQIPNNLTPAEKSAIAAVPYSNSVKIGLQMARRFWETDDYI